MGKNNSTKKIIQCIALATTLAVLPITTPPVYAAGWLDVVATGAAAASVYQQLDKDITKMDTTGRNQYFEEIKNKYGVYSNWQENQQLSQIVSRLSNAAAPTNPDIKRRPFNYFINPSKDFNAFCTLGHNLSVNKGVFTILNHNTDEIAAVVAHEMGHGLKNHPRKGAHKSMNLSVLKAIYDVQNPGYLATIGSNVVAANIQNRGITMPQEKEADNVAFDYYTAAGYNIGAGAALWQRIEDKMPTYKSFFLGELFAPKTHPGETWRRDNYAKKLTDYSKGHVSVDAKSGMVKINKKNFLIPSEVGDMSSKERAYLVAGNLAAVYHNNTVIPEATLKGNYIYIGIQPIMSIGKNDKAQKLIDILNKIR